MTTRIDSMVARLLQTRAAVRAPIRLYRLGAGWIFGRRMVMLEHTGRRAGQPRHVCLEVVERPSDSEIVVVSGFGERADWYQNLLADPACRVSIGRRRGVQAWARFLSKDESDAALRRYQVAHPKAWRRLSGALEQAVGHSVEGLPMVSLTLGRRSRTES